MQQYAQTEVVPRHVPSPQRLHLRGGRIVRYLAVGNGVDRANKKAAEKGLYLRCSVVALAFCQQFGKEWLEVLSHSPTPHQCLYFCGSTICPLVAHILVLLLSRQVPSPPRLNACCVLVPLSLCVLSLVFSQLQPFQPAKLPLDHPLQNPPPNEIRGIHARFDYCVHVKRLPRLARTVPSLQPRDNKLQVGFTAAKQDVLKLTSRTVPSPYGLYSSGSGVGVCVSPEELSCTLDSLFCKVPSEGLLHLPCCPVAHAVFVYVLNAPTGEKEPHHGLDSQHYAVLKAPPPLSLAQAHAQKALYAKYGVEHRVYSKAELSNRLFAVIQPCIFDYLHALFVYHCSEPSANKLLYFYCCLCTPQYYHPPSYPLL
mmetsp:Transcript_11583/g.31048  ORF Transcript_11583/g.31048 Transcript_11583/m.31048 type:complete len:369 (+) Transcript_11583:4345-5451(+)